MRCIAWLAAQDHLPQAQYAHSPPSRSPNIMLIQMNGLFHSVPHKSFLCLSPPLPFPPKHTNLGWRTNIIPLYTCPIRALCTGYCYTMGSVIFTHISNLENAISLPELVGSEKKTFFTISISAKSMHTSKPYARAYKSRLLLSILFSPSQSYILQAACPCPPS